MILTDGCMQCLRISEDLVKNYKVQNEIFVCVNSAQYLYLKKLCIKPRGIFLSGKLAGLPHIFCNYCVPQ
jgi:hypothetical protein